MANIYPFKNRKIVITKNKGNTHYSVYVIDSYGTEHHLGYYEFVMGALSDGIEEKAQEIWANEVEPKEDLLGDAIANMIELEKKSGIRFTDSRGNHRDGLD